MRFPLLTTLAALALPVAAAAQSGSGRADAAAQSQATTQSPEARIQAALTAAAAASIPRSLLESKVAEGRAKRVPEDRIAVAVEQRLQALVRASTALRRAEIETVSEGELAVTADALQAGVGEATLLRVSRGTESGRRVVAIAVLADLVRLGHDPDRASARVTAAAATSAMLASLHAEVASQLRVSGLSSTLDAAGIIRVP